MPQGWPARISTPVRFFFFHSYLDGLWFTTNVGSIAKQCSLYMHCTQFYDLFLQQSLKQIIKGIQSPMLACRKPPGKVTNGDCVTLLLSSPKNDKWSYSEQFLYCCLLMDRNLASDYLHNCSVNTLRELLERGPSLLSSCIPGIAKLYSLFALWKRAPSSHNYIPSQEYCNCCKYMQIAKHPPNSDCVTAGMPYRF